MARNQKPKQKPRKKNPSKKHAKTSFPRRRFTRGTKSLKEIDKAKARNKSTARKKDTAAEAKTNRPSRRNVTHILFVANNEVLFSWKNPGLKRVFEIGTKTSEIASLLYDSKKGNLLFVNMQSKRNVSVLDTIYTAPFTKTDIGECFYQGIGITNQTLNFIEIIKLLVFIKVKRYSNAKGGIKLHKAIAEVALFFQNPRQLNKVLR